AAMVHDLIEHRSREAGWDREADALSAARAGDDGRVDADQLPGRVDQRTSGIARVDRRVGLDEVLEGRDTEAIAPGRAHDALRYGLADAIGIPDGKHDISDAHPIGLADGDDRYRIELDLEDCQ